MAEMNSLLEKEKRVGTQKETNQADVKQLRELQKKESTSSSSESEYESSEEEKKEKRRSLKKKKAEGKK